MKKTFRSLGFLLALTVTFSACSKNKDESETPAGNYVKYNGNSYVLHYAQNDSEGSSYSNFLLISLDVKSGQTSGKASGVNIVFDNLTTTPGTYTYKDDSDPSYDKTKNFFDAIAFFNMDFPNQTGGTVLEDITSGTVTVTREGSNYTVAYELNFDGAVVTGKYTGAVQEIN
jgi:hypothetical protein